MPPPTPPAIPPFQRVMIFVDGTNLLTSMAKMLDIQFNRKKTLSDKHSESSLSAATNLIQHPFGGIKFKVIRKYWFSSYKGNDYDRIEISERLRNKGYEPVLFKKKPDNREKGVDIALTMSFLLNAINQNFDIGLLVAGDEDYVGLVNEVKRYGPRIYGSFLEFGLSKELKLSCDKFTLMKINIVTDEMKEKIILDMNC
jgi:uncharacterized LabA/DUF88 family protein